MSLIIKTERLILRRYRKADLEDILEFSRTTDWWLERILPWEVDSQDITDYWEKVKDLNPFKDPRWFDLVIEVKSLGKVAGIVGYGVTVIDEQHKQGMVGWLLGCDYQGQGYASEAAQAIITFGFSELSLHRISARTGMDNAPSWKMMERLGMRREAHFRESHTVKGQWRDEYIYAVLLHEWQTSTRNTPRNTQSNND
ncbi:GNAT family N-acetyltransferase [candidate division WOR-3 bacterium]|uniref:GNAT family N-acetyltransferase n=1 Tax=candidate division WOR-3 bacterium TaxID=2052148 RepID=A0A9D5QCT2_UNCW3|nr:GNAT family N-acetyltransferase [candidate division WOR-3 bacterium]MBD3364316.1 GNAT family N-acetyltransferase [candidate division WOR-3 bacterium]